MRLKPIAELLGIKSERLRRGKGPVDILIGIDHAQMHIGETKQSGKLCTYHWLSRGLTPGTPTGNPREHAGNGTFLTIFWARGVGTLFGFGNERFRPQGCTPGIWSPLVSGTWFSKSRMNSLPPFVFHFLDLLHVCSSSCRCTKPGMFYEEKESLLLPTVSMNSL